MIIFSVICVRFFRFGSHLTKLYFSRNVFEVNKTVKKLNNSLTIYAILKVIKFPLGYIKGGILMNAPLYRRASATGENLTLANDHIRLEFYKRICGWGWAEIWTPDRRMIAVLDHF